MTGWGKKQNSDNHQGGLPKFVKNNRNRQSRDEAAAQKQGKTSGKANKNDGNKGKR